MKKISIITMQNVINYGSVLQTYATQNILEELGYEVEFIDYIRENQVNALDKTEKPKSHNPKEILRMLYRKYIGSSIVKRRARTVFDGFIKENIHTTRRRYYSTEELRKDCPAADIYCTGSDQMWNSGWNGGIEYSYFLDFVRDRPKFAFSTSIGMDAIPVAEKEETLRLLKDYNFITVREQSAAKLLNQIGIAATTVLDPTLMVDGEFWKRFSENSYRPEKQKYILVYQLNSVHDNLDFKAYVKRLSQEMGLPVKAINYGVTRHKVFDEHIFMPTMEEFVGLFANAAYVVTDSFHGTSFSINLNRPFSVVYPRKYSTRLANILDICKLNDRVVSAPDSEIHKEKIDYSSVNDILNPMRKECIQVISNGLKEITI